MRASDHGGVAKVPRAICWAARISGVAAIAFLSLFALDVFQPGAPRGAVLLALVIHLVPSFVLAGVLVVAWRMPLAGGVLFIAAAILPFLLLSNPPLTNAILAAPFALTGVLFLACRAAVDEIARRLTALVAYGYIAVWQYTSTQIT